MNTATLSLDLLLSVRSVCYGRGHSTDGQAMKRRRSDPYRVAIPWEPVSTGLGSDFAESLLTGGLLAAVIILGDRAIFRAWALFWLHGSDPTRAGAKWGRGQRR